ncbi:1584_t:CDS:2 [Ambispora gerdemannii]|uniref:1584_t:CDS:1 n=1 Tax=Ambispora gerdemannii TaxID=144530 RepID=A0A9N8YLF5_9GLOM|nr:1584_t:CDS:2 [Ambispora gerdemannii]
MSQFSEEPAETDKNFLSSTDKNLTTRTGGRRQFTYSEKLLPSQNVEQPTSGERQFSYSDTLASTPNVGNPEIDNDSDSQLPLATNPIYPPPVLSGDGYVKQIHKRPPLPSPVVINPVYPPPALPEDTKDPKKTFNVEEILDIVKEVTDVVLQDSAYLHTRVSTWNKQIVNSCVKKLCGLGKAFKYIVTCTIVQKTDAGLHSTSSCYWDARFDGCAKFHRDLKNMDVVVNVFGLAV